MESKQAEMLCVCNLENEFCLMSKIKMIENRVYQRVYTYHRRRKRKS